MIYAYFGNEQTCLGIPRNRVFLRESGKAFVGYKIVAYTILYPTKVINARNIKSIFVLAWGWDHKLIAYRNRRIWGLIEVFYLIDKHSKNYWTTYLHWVNYMICKLNLSKAVKTLLFSHLVAMVVNLKIKIHLQHTFVCEFFQNLVCQLENYYVRLANASRYNI